MNEDDDEAEARVREMLLEAIEPLAPPPGRAAAIKQRVLERVHAERAGSGPDDHPGAGHDASGAATAAPPSRPDRDGLVTLRADEGEWRRFLPKVDIKVLHRDGDTLSYLLRIEPGGAVVPHRHPQDEECVVLEGEARIGALHLKQGDYHRAPAGGHHGVLSSDRGALLFLRGAVPAAEQVRWLDAGTLVALAPPAVRRFVERW
ncbi:MAG TPA: cupin domain-containing protein [Burkholderiaceae bacterium]|nr:cupin domain-containing protein [Burkholderiaceae bacterium]